MNKNDFNYFLPEELIAQTPLSNRSASKLLILNKITGEIIHSEFKKIEQLINPGDCIVLNNTKVIPARIMGHRNNLTGAVVEVLLLNKLDDFTYEVLTYPGKKAKIGDTIVFGNGELSAEIINIINGGVRVVKFIYEGIFNEILDKLGEMPLPPYITTKLNDKNRYQTIYAKEEGSAAAPTAGLHFTDEIFNSLKNNNVKIAHITLHVGLGTFRPVKTQNILEHQMHSEYYNLNDTQANIINTTKKNGGKIIAVGTTSCRTLESCADNNGFVKAQKGWTDIFIYPGYKFKIIDSLITNFHLPESTLIMLVSALAGRENILNAYNDAIKRKYRFFSFGDAMIIQ